MSNSKMVNDEPKDMVDETAMEEEQDILTALPVKQREKLDKQIAKIADYWKTNGFSNDVEVLKEQISNFQKHFVEDHDEAPTNHVHLADMAEILLQRNEHELSIMFAVLSCWFNPKECREDIDIFNISSYHIMLSVEGAFELKSPGRHQVREKALHWLEYYLADVKDGEAIPLHKCLLVMSLSVYIVKILLLQEGCLDSFQHIISRCQTFLALFDNDMDKEDLHDIQNNENFSFLSQYQREVQSHSY